MSGQLDDIPVSVGDVIADKYKLVRVLGVGGMGAVLEAHHLQLNQSVALKFLSPQMCKNDQSVKRFMREAQAAARIQSDHVVRVMDVGTHEGRVPYLVMECLRGRGFDVMIEDSGVLPVVDTVDYLLQACEAVAEAHAAGIVHRDLKPGNLFLATRKDGTTIVKVLDFGISKLMPSAAGPNHNITATTAVLGSPLYTSPEQMLNSKNVDGRVDIWALGVILYECLTGRSPFTAETLPELYVRIATSTPEPIRSIRTDVPEELEAAVFQCLEKQPEDRFQNVAALAAAIGEFASEEGRRSVAKVARILGVAEPAARPVAAVPADGSGPALAGGAAGGSPLLPSLFVDSQAEGAGSGPIEQGTVAMVPEAENAPTEKIESTDMARTTGLPESPEPIVTGAGRGSAAVPTPGEIARQTSAAWGATRGDSRRSGKVAVIAAFAVLGVVAVGAAGALHFSRASRSATSGEDSPVDVPLASSTAQGSPGDATAAASAASASPASSVDASAAPEDASARVGAGGASAGDTAARDGARSAPTAPSAGAKRATPVKPTPGKESAPPATSSPVIPDYGDRR